MQRMTGQLLRLYQPAERKNQSRCCHLIVNVEAVFHNADAPSVFCMGSIATFQDLIQQREFLNKICCAEKFVALRNICAKLFYCALFSCVLEIQTRFLRLYKVALKIIFALF